MNFPEMTFDDMLAPQSLRRQADECQKGGELPGAQALWLESLRRDAGSAPAWLGYGRSLLPQGRVKAAALAFEQALRLAPHHDKAVVLEALSDTYMRLGRTDDCARVLQRLAVQGVDSPALMFRRAKTAMNQRRFDEAGAVFDRLSQDYPDDASLRFERSMLRLRGGPAATGWASAWDDYEARFAVYGHDGLTSFPHAFAPWQGENLHGRNLLVHREQGYGDMIMFASALADLQRTAAQVVVSLPPALLRLFAHSFPGVHCAMSRVVEGNAALLPQDWLAAVPRIDAQLPFCSLGARLRRNAAAFGKPRAYLTADAATQAKFAAYLAAMSPAGGACRKVGLVWAARLAGTDGAVASNGSQKSMGADQLGPLAAVKDVQWVSLLNRPGGDDAALAPALQMLDFGWAIRDFHDTAALISQLDLVVAVDTAVAHLAAAMGKETWLLLRWHPDWRWDHEGQPSPWYPKVRLFRQRVEGDWSAPLRQVAQSLNEYAGGRP